MKVKLQIDAFVGNKVFGSIETLFGTLSTKLLTTAILTSFSFCESIYTYVESGITFPIQNGEESYCDKQNWHQLKCVLSYLQLVDDVDGWLAGRDIPGGCIN